jgi:hypothetical protein
VSAENREDEEPYEMEVEPGGPCCLCHEPIERGYMVTDDDGYRYCEDCWQP